MLTYAVIGLGLLVVLQFAAVVTLARQVRHLEDELALEDLTCRSLDTKYRDLTRDVDRLYGRARR